MRFLVLALAAILSLGMIGCSTEALPFEYKPAVQVEGQVYWHTPDGTVRSIPEDSRVIGRIETISIPTQPPQTDGEAIGFSQDFLHHDIWQSPEDTSLIYIFNEELAEYIPFSVEQWLLTKD